MQVSLFLFWLLAWHRCSFCHRPHSAATVASNQWKTMFMPSTHTLFVMKNTETQDVNNIFRLHQQFHSFPLMGGRATVCAWLPLITIEADFFHLCSCMWWWYTYLARSLFCLCTLWGCGAIYLLWLSMPEQTRVQHEEENEHTVICLLRFVFFLSLCTVHTSRTNASCPNRQSHSWTHVKCITLIIICKSSVFNGLRLGCWITTIITKMYYVSFVSSASSFCPLMVIDGLIPAISTQLNQLHSADMHKVVICDVIHNSPLLHYIIIIVRWVCSLPQWVIMKNELKMMVFDWTHRHCKINRFYLDTRILLWSRSTYLYRHSIAFVLEMATNMWLPSTHSTQQTSSLSSLHRKLTRCEALSSLDNRTHHQSSDYQFQYSKYSEFMWLYCWMNPIALYAFAIYPATNLVKLSR